MVLPTPRNIAASVRDLRTFLVTRERREWLFAGIAIAITAYIIFGIWYDSRAPRQTGQEIIFVQNWRADRPDSEIVAEQKQERIERDKAEAARRASYRRLQNATAGWL